MKQLIIIFMVCVLCTSCSNSWITSSWTKPNTEGVVKYNKIMVLAITGQDRGLREAMESNAVAQLRELGYNAASSYTEYGPEELDSRDEANAVDRLTNSGVDAVLTIVLLDVNKERNYVPGRVLYAPYSTYYDHFWGYYSTVYDRIYSPGYYTVDTRYFWESNVYKMSNREMVYSVQTEAFDPSSASDLGEDHAELIVKDMVRNNVLIGR